MRRSGMRKILFIMLFVVLLFGFFSCSSITIGKASKIDFKNLLFYAKLYKAVRFGGEDVTRREYAKYFPEKMKIWIRQVLQMPDGALRRVGFVLMCTGVLLVYIGRQ